MLGVHVYGARERERERERVRKGADRAREMELLQWNAKVLVWSDGKMQRWLRA
jgi:hypothetical protein